MIFVTIISHGTRVRPYVVLNLEYLSTQARALNSW